MRVVGHINWCRVLTSEGRFTLRSGSPSSCRHFRPHPLPPRSVASGGSRITPAVGVERGLLARPSSGVGRTHFIGNQPPPTCSSQNSLATFGRSMSAVFHPYQAGTQRHAALHVVSMAGRRLRSTRCLRFSGRLEIRSPGVQHGLPIFQPYPQTHSYRTRASSRQLSAMPTRRSPAAGTGPTLAHRDDTKLHSAQKSSSFISGCTRRDSLIEWNRSQLLTTPTATAPLPERLTAFHLP